MKRYQIIYADPPWSYKVWSEDKKSAQGCAKRYYQTMSVEDICKLRVSEISELDCKLFLWATPPCLPEALRVMKAWGFEYKTIAFCWIKTNPKSKTPFYGIGHWTASNCELVLAGLKKGGKLNRQSKSISQIDMSPRGKHSVKPDSIRRKIVELCGDIPRIELFARKENKLFDDFKGWDVWGNEVKSDIELT
jgi:N6-adenosine-specific RNA methylase IME4